MEDVCEPQNKIAFIVPTHTHTLSLSGISQVHFQMGLFQGPLIICLMAIVSASSGKEKQMGGEEAGPQNSVQVQRVRLKT